jgi:hypothetical protein
MHTNFRRFLEERNVIQANPSLAMLRTLRFVWFFMLACLFALIVVSCLLEAIFGGGQHFSASPLLFPFPLLVTSAFNLAITIAQERYWEAIEQRRFAAVHGDRALLAAEQPTPHAALVRLPLTITLGYHKALVLWMMGGVVLMALLFAGAIFAGVMSLPNTGPLLLTSHRLLSFLVIFSVLAVIGLALLFVVVFSGLGRQQIEVTEHGLCTRYGERTGRVMWEEAHLFALYGTFGAQKSRAVLTYELSSAREIVRWIWVQRKTYVLGLKPTIPLDEYNRQMQALLSLIAARTGLPLYDLR